MIEGILSWIPHIEFCCKKLQQHIYFQILLISDSEWHAVLQYGLAQQLIYETFNYTI